MLTVWGRRDSSNVQAVMWGIAELGLEHRRIDAGHRFGVNDTPEFLAMNPNGLVPVIRDGDGPALFESAAILRYLANRYGRAPFWPEDVEARAQVDMWAEWAKQNIVVPFTGGIFLQLVRTPEAQRDLGQVARTVKALTKPLAIAEARLAQHPWICGEAMTLADIQMGNVLYRYHTLPFERPELPALSAYYERLTQHAPYAEHVMVPYDALRPAAGA
jgi:glutathione S-transferase